LKLLHDIYFNNCYNTNKYSN